MAKLPGPGARPASVSRLTIISGGQTGASRTEDDDGSARTRSALIGTIANAGVDMAALLAAERFLRHRPPRSGHDTETDDSPADPRYQSHSTELDIAGFVPLHYTNETGAYSIPERFRPFLTETASVESRERTERNMAQSDGILTLSLSSPDEHAVEGVGSSALAVSAGTQLGVEYAASLGKSAAQMLFVNLGQASEHTANVDRTVRWLRNMDVQRCAVGGPRESEAPGIQDKAEEFLCAVFARYLNLSAQGIQDALRNS